jgi:hypothetical protein
MINVISVGKVLRNHSACQNTQRLSANYSRTLTARENRRDMRAFPNLLFLCSSRIHKKMYSALSYVFKSCRKFHSPEAAKVATILSIRKYYSTNLLSWFVLMHKEPVFVTVKLQLVSATAEMYRLHKHSEMKCWNYIKHFLYKSVIKHASSSINHPCPHMQYYSHIWSLVVSLTCRPGFKKSLLVSGQYVCT